MYFPILNTLPQHTTWSALLELLFISTYPADSSFFLTSQTSVNRQNDFLALQFLTIMGGPGDIGLLSVNISGVYTIYASIISLNYSWSLHFPEDVYSWFIFSRHLCLYIAQLFNYWSFPMVTICCFSWSDINKPLIMTQCCSNDSTPGIK